jgi:hypothetical protein
VLTLLVAIHFWRIRKDGGLSRPEAEVFPAVRPNLLPAPEPVPAMAAWCKPG